MHITNGLFQEMPSSHAFATANDSVWNADALEIGSDDAGLTSGCGAVDDNRGITRKPWLFRIRKTSVDVVMWWAMTSSQ
jgi:hypothetical protein